jgi:hypothetical protein
VSFRCGGRFHLGWLLFVLEDLDWLWLLAFLRVLKHDFRFLSEVKLSYRLFFLVVDGVLLRLTHDHLIVVILDLVELVLDDVFFGALLASNSRWELLDVRLRLTVGVGALLVVDVERRFYDKG